MDINKLSSDYNKKLVTYFVYQSPNNPDKQLSVEIGDGKNQVSQELLNLILDYARLHNNDAGFNQNDPSFKKILTQAMYNGLSNAEKTTY